MHEDSLTAGGQLAVGAEFAGQDVVAAADLLDPSAQFEFGVERGWLVEADIQRASDARLASHDLSDTKKMVKQGADMATMDGARRAFVSPAQGDATIPGIAIDPGHQRRRQWIALAIQRAELMAETVSCSGLFERFAASQSRGLFEGGKLGTELCAGGA